MKIDILINIDGLEDLKEKLKSVSNISFSINFDN